LKKLLFTSNYAQDLYEKYAHNLPIIDFHCHLQPKEIYENIRFENLGEMWLKHDHYKWRAMRLFGVAERFITGNASFKEKFLAFANIFPLLAGNPLYVWCTLELKRYFNIDIPLSSVTAEEIYADVSRQIEDRNLRPRDFFELSNVDYVATTDDPIDNLSYHSLIADDATLKTQVCPAFRPDKAMNISAPGFVEYIHILSHISGVSINDFQSLETAIENRLQFFMSHGCKIADAGIDNLIWGDPESANDIFTKVLNGGIANFDDVYRYQTAFLLMTNRLYAKHGLISQLHIGAMRNVNSCQYNALGADTGFDTCGNAVSLQHLAKLLDTLNDTGSLPQIILYPLDPNQAEAVAIIAASFCGDGRSKVTLGAPWWFNDQPNGIRRQFESVSEVYPVALFPGMVTDSRSFLSYPRHEVYRRIFCDYLASLVERGLYPRDDAALSTIIRSVCCENIKLKLELK